MSKKHHCTLCVFIAFSPKFKDSSSTFDQKYFVTKRLKFGSNEHQIGLYSFFLYLKAYRVIKHFWLKIFNNPTLKAINLCQMGTIAPLVVQWVYLYYSLFLILRHILSSHTRCQKCLTILEVLDSCQIGITASQMLPWVSICFLFIIWAL